MKSILRRRPSPALVISLIALFVSLSGVSYGVATGFIDSREIKNNEIRSLDIRNNQIRTRDLRNNEVRGIDIRNSTVQGRDIALNTVTGEDVKEDTLRKVPSALLADTATRNANGVSTLKIIPRPTLAEGAPAGTLATHGPLTLSAARATESAVRPATRLLRRSRTTPPRAERRRPKRGPRHAPTTELRDRSTPRRRCTRPPRSRRSSRRLRQRQALHRQAAVYADARHRRGHLHVPRAPALQG